MSILDCQLIELQFESICSNLDFFQQRNTCKHPLFRHATKEYRLSFNEESSELMKKSTMYHVQCTKYEVRIPNLISTRHGCRQWTVDYRWKMAHSWRSIDHNKLYQVPSTRYEVWILNQVWQRHGCRLLTVNRWQCGNCLTLLNLSQNSHFSHCRSACKRQEALALPRQMYLSVQAWSWSSVAVTAGAFSHACWQKQAEISWFCGDSSLAGTLLARLLGKKKTK